MTDRLLELLDAFRDCAVRFYIADTHSCNEPIVEANELAEARRQVEQLFTELGGQLKCAQAATVGTREGYREAIAEMASEYKPDDTTVELMWQLLCVVEGAAGKNAGPLDTALIRASYRHMSQVMGKPLVPKFLPPEHQKVTPT
jgi:hypothetical protein